MPVIHFKTFLNKLNFELRRLFSGNEKGFLDPNSKVSNFWRRSITSIQKAKIARSSGLISSILLVLLSFSAVFPIYFAKDKTEAVGTASTTTLTITNAVTAAAVDLSVTSANGTFAVSSSNVAFGVKTNNYTGYTVSLSPKTSSTALTNNIKNNATNTYATFTSIGSSMSESTFSADTEAAGTAYNGKWGVKPSKYNSTANSNYLPSPTSSSAMLIEKTTSPNASTANTYTIGIGARAGYEQAAGTYSNTYVLTVIGNATNYSLDYTDNSNESKDIPADSTNQSTTTTYFTLSSVEPTRNGYVFLGWCTANTSDNTCSGTTYQPGDSYPLNQTTSNVPKLYAIWGRSMQTMSLSDCKVNVGTSGNSANIGSNITVYDARDKNSYTVRYINGQCWMTQNLRFTGAKLDSTTSNVDSKYTKNSPLTIAWYDLVDDARTESGKCWGTDLDLQYNEATGKYEYNYTLNYGSKGYSNACLKETSLGVQYNFAGASAMSIIGASNTIASEYSVCPANWHIPSGPPNNQNTDFYRVFNSTSDDWLGPNAYLNAFQATVGGGYVNGKVYFPNHGYYWANTALDNLNRTRLRYDSDNNIFRGGGGGNYRSFGEFLRCVLSTAQSISNVAYMQDVKKDMVANSANYAVATLIDRRDGNAYTVKKINGLLWMTQDLRIRASSNDMLYGESDGYISPVDSNFSNDFPIYIGNSLSSDSRCKDMTEGGSGYNTACSEASVSSTSGAWYNYCAATAHSICSSAGSISEASADICPYGWHLPSGPATSAGTDYYQLYQSTTNGIAPNAFLNAFSVSPIGFYGNGSIVGNGTYSTWTATAYSSMRRYYLRYDGSKFYGANNSGIWSYGVPIRCVFGS